MSDYEVGQRADITFEGALITHIKPSGVCAATEAGADIVFAGDDPQVTVVNAVPADWPPRAGDLWQHDNGALWFAIADGANVVLHSARGATLSPQEAYEQRREMRLKHREVRS